MNGHCEEQERERGLMNYVIKSMNTSMCKQLNKRTYIYIYIYIYIYKLQYCYLKVYLSCVSGFFLSLKKIDFSFFLQQSSLFSLHVKRRVWNFLSQKAKDLWAKKKAYFLFCSPCQNLKTFPCRTFYWNNIVYSYIYILWQRSKSKVASRFLKERFRSHQ